jgi:AAA+ ATPase superfamily predicted ATPase
MKFYGRKEELGLMEHLYIQSPSFLVVTGRRRVGKTELILEFCKEKPAIYFYVDANKSIGSLLDEFSRLMRESLNLPGYIKFETPEAFLEFLFSYREPLVVVFDEFQRFQKIDPSFISQLQRYWDTSRRNSRLFIIVSGSSIGMIREIFLSGGAPLFKRADTILTLKPFGPRDCLSILSDIGVTNPEEKLNLYLLFGGTIYYYTYLEKFGCTDMETALNRLLLNDFAPLAQEMRDIVVEEFGREHTTYYEILAAIASGKQSHKEIADAIHIAPTSLPTYLRDLLDLLGIIEYCTPITERGRRSKMGRYIFSDNFFRFYARYIYRNRSLYQAGRYEKLLDMIKTEWKGFSGFAFEEMVRTLLKDRLIPEYDAVGSWWNRRGDEIDLLAISDEADLALEIRNTTLTRSGTYSILTSLQAKLPAVQGLSCQVSLGIVAREIEDIAGFRKEGFYCMELLELLEQNSMYETQLQ